MKIAIVLALLSALWDGPGRAVVIWQGSGCLYRNQTLLACYPREASYTIVLGAEGPIDAAYRAQAGDVYRLVRPGGAVEETKLRSVVYFPLWK